MPLDYVIDCHVEASQAEEKRDLMTSAAVLSVRQPSHHYRAICGRNDVFPVCVGVILFDFLVFYL